MKQAVFLLALIVVAAACPDGYTTTNDHCVDEGRCTTNSGCGTHEECCFPTNGACDSICSPLPTEAPHHTGPPVGK